MVKAGVRKAGLLDRYSPGKEETIDYVSELLRPNGFF